MHEVSKRVLFRALLKGGMSKAAISRVFLGSAGGRRRVGRRLMVLAGAPRL